MCWSPQLLLERLCIARLLDAVLEVEGWYTQLHLVSSSAKHTNGGLRIGSRLTRVASSGQIDTQLEECTQCGCTCVGGNG